MNATPSHGQLSDRGSSSVPPSTKKIVVVVGGGFAGRSAVRVLSASNRNGVDFTLTLVDRSPVFEFTPGVLRCIVNPHRLDDTIAPHTAIEPHAKFVQGCVTSLDGNYITFTSPDSAVPNQLRFDYCIWATGSSYMFPIGTRPGVLVHHIDERRAQLAELHNQIMTSSSVSIVGAGPVGVELAAEIAIMSNELSSQENRRVTIYTRESSDGLLPGFTPSARKYADMWLRKAGVKITTASVNDDCSDICFRCTGSTPSLPELSSNNLHSYLGLIIQAHGMSAIDAMKAGQIAARDILRVVRSRTNKTGIVTRKVKSSVKVAIISLGDRDAILCAGPFTLTGLMPAMIKRFVQVINVKGMRGNTLASWMARRSSAFATWIGRIATRMERNKTPPSINLSHTHSKWKLD